MLLSDKNQFLRESFRLNAMLLLKCNDNFTLMKSAVDESNKYFKKLALYVDCCNRKKTVDIE